MVYGTGTYLTNQKEEFTDYLPFSISHGRKNILKGVLYYSPESTGKKLEIQF